MPIKRPARFAHVVYRTRRFDEMLQWYKTVFDARVQYENPGLAFLTFDNEHHRFAFANMSVLHPEGTEIDRSGDIGVDHVAYTYGSIRDLLENYAELKGNGISPYWCVHHDLTVSMYYADPDGNQMEFQVDCLPEGIDPGAFMAESFASNPIGVEYNPEEWLGRLRTGEDESSFAKRTVHEPVSPIRGIFAEILSA